QDANPRCSHLHFETLSCQSCILYVLLSVTSCRQETYGRSFMSNGTGVAIDAIVNETRKPQMDLRGACAVGGRPGAMLVSPDGSRLFVFDQDRAQVSIVGVAAWQLLGKADLASFRFFLAGFEDSIFLGGLPGTVGIFNAASLRRVGAIPCAGDACDLAILPESRQAVLSAASGRQGFLDLVGLSPVRTVARMEMPLPPVCGSLPLLPRPGAGRRAASGGG